MEFWFTLLAVWLFYEWISDLTEDLCHSGERVQIRARTERIPLSSLIAHLLQAGYSKNQEQEADRQGPWLAVRAYFSYGTIRLVKELDEGIREALQKPSTGTFPGDYTHFGTQRM